MRTACLLAICVALAGVGTLAASRAADAPRGTPAAFIDLGAIFGGDDENEADENEPDDGSPTQHQPAGRQADRRSRISLPMFLAVVLGAIGALFVANRVRRLRLRMRAWLARR
ncbi:MAG TPA: hypothetical protein VK510_18550 [Solirubrobacteraceae bacterium]|jgi:hypothetical protein|nr:hypothetical protein [Solirubrobacteraceae bacterium]